MSTETSEVLHGPGADVRSQGDGDPAQGRAARLDVQVDLQGGGRGGGGVQNVTTKHSSHKKMK